MIECVKCKHPADGATITEGGINYPFCDTCTKILELFPRSTNIMHIFLNPDDKSSQENKNIYEARKRRTKGHLLWNK